MAMSDCRCVYCGVCVGTGSVFEPTDYGYPEDDLERCEDCDGTGIAERCAYCREQEEREDWEGLDDSEEDDYIMLRCGECDAVIVEGESHDPECSRA